MLLWLTKRNTRSLADHVEITWPTPDLGPIKVRGRVPPSVRTCAFLCDDTEGTVASQPGKTCSPAATISRRCLHHSNASYRSTVRVSSP